MGYYVPGFRRHFNKPLSNRLPDGLSLAHRMAAASAIGYVSMQKRRGHSVTVQQVALRPSMNSVPEVSSKPVFSGAVVMRED